MAVHTTSQSWEDIRLTCSLLDLKVPTSTISKGHMKTFLAATTSVVAKSMEISASQVHSSTPTTALLSDNLRSGTVSFNTSWHRRGHFSNQGFAAAIDSEYGKVLDYQLYDRVCYLCSKWPEERNENNPEEYEEYWSLINFSVPRTFLVPPNRWRAPPPSKSGVGPLLVIVWCTILILVMVTHLPTRI